MIPSSYKRQRIKADFEHFFAEPQSVWVRQASYQQYRKNFIETYQLMCRKEGRKECRSWMTRLLWGFREDELRAYAQEFVADELRRPLETEKVRLAEEDPSAVEIQRGLRPIAELKALAKILLASGFDVWVVADDPQWILEAMAKEYGVDPSRVAGIRLESKDGKLGSQILDPIPFKGGKVEALVAGVGRPPALVVGSDIWDIDMLDYGGRLRLLLDKGDVALRDTAAEKGWLLCELRAETASLEDVFAKLTRG